MAPRGNDPASCILLLGLGLCLAGRVWWAEGVELSFDDKYQGFFLKSGHEESVEPNGGTVLGRDQFLVVQPSRATMVRVGYGPFTAKQTVPYPSSLPLVSLNQSVDLFSRWPATTDVKAYLVTKDVRHEWPVLRALFHFTQSGREAGAGSTHDYQNLCVLLMATCDGRRRTTVCSPSPRDTSCLAELSIPRNWWPAFRDGKGVKMPKKKMIAVEYAVAVDVRRSECNEAHVRGTGPSQSTATPLWQVPLVADAIHYSEVVQNGSLQILIPRVPLYPRSKLYVPVFVRKSSESPVNVFVMRARVKSGLRILEAEPYDASGWSITVDLNAKRTVATVTAFFHEQATTGEQKTNEEFGEVFSWLLEVDDGADFQRSTRVSWSIRYVQEAGRALHRKLPDDNVRFLTEIDVLKDDIQTVLLVSKTWELVNTAVLNGKQVSLPIKVFIVSRAGKVADVTLQSSCSSADESILKVSPSCTSVYLDGSEIRGSHNASVVVRYGTYIGHAHFQVWLPELPLDIHVQDERLSQIRNWKAPKEMARKLIPRTRGGDGQGKRSAIRVHEEESRPACRLRYQQTAVDVFAKFIAVDDESGREFYLLDRRSAFRITELVEDYLRVADSRIAMLKGRIVQGQSTGRTEVQILSPITGRVIGATELRVGKDKETITGLKVEVVTGLQLSIKPNYDVRNGFVAETTITRHLTAQYQEGLLDLSLVFSDGTSTPLSQVAESDFSLSLLALESGVVALAPMASSHRPRVIALGEGDGGIRVSLEMTDSCSKRDARPLATASVDIGVRMKRSPEKAGLQNDEFNLARARAEDKFFGGGMQARANDANFIRSMSREPSVQARQNPVHSDVSPLEIGMYALLGIFCLAIAVFVASCAVYAVQFHQKQVEQADGNDPVANAHDWVWLGRSTLERKAVETRRPRAREGNICGVRSDDLRFARCREMLSSREVSVRWSLQASSQRPAARSLVASDIVSVANENAIPFCDEVPIKDSPCPFLVERRVQIAADRSSSSADERHLGSPPPVPPHGRPMPSQRASSCSARSAVPGEKELPWPSSTSPVDYDVLVEYFDNLKESNA